MHIDQLVSECGARTTSISITWELGRKEMFGHHPRPTKSENLRVGLHVCFHKPSGNFWCRLKFEDHWLRETDSLLEKEASFEGEYIFAAIRAV